MKLTLELLSSHNACQPGVDWWKQSKCKTVETTARKLLKEKRYDWANWLLSHVLTPDNKVSYAIFAAEAVLAIYEKQYPKDDRPRKAIEADKAYLKAKGKDRAAGDAAWDAAWAAARAAARDAAGDAAEHKMYAAIITYGVSLVQKQ